MKDIDFDLDDYLRLVDWTGRAIRDNTKGSIPANLALILTRLGLEPDNWLTTISQYNRHHFSVLGSMDRIKRFAQVQKKRWCRGQGVALHSYRLLVVE